MISKVKQKFFGLFGKIKVFHFRFKPRENLVDRRFGKLVVIRMLGVDYKHQMVCECRCDCGKLKIARAASLKSGGLVSCNCAHSDNIKHGHTRRGKHHPLYGPYAKMIARCENPNDAKYHLYGAQGIKVCKRWRRSFAAFLGDMGKRPSGHSLERKDNLKGYCPSNCKWASAKEQAANRRCRSDSTFITYNNETLPLASWARKVGLKASIISKRLKIGWPVERAMTTPSRGY